MWKLDKRISLRWDHPLPSPKLTRDDDGHLWVYGRHLEEAVANAAALGDVRPEDLTRVIFC